MRFELLTFERQAKSSIVNFGETILDAGNSTEFSVLGFFPSKGRPARFLLYISKDPIGWKYQFFFRIFSLKYRLAVSSLQYRIKYPKGVPQKTGGKKVVTKLGPLGHDEVTLPGGTKAYYDPKAIK